MRGGALDGRGGRKMLLAGLDQAISAAQARQRAMRKGQIDLFSIAGQSPALAIVRPEKEPPDIPHATLLAGEKELLGVYLSSHPLDDYVGVIRRDGLVQIAEIDEESAGETVEVIAIVAQLRKLTTRSNRVMAVCQLEDRSGSIELVIFPDLYEESRELLAEALVLRVDARHRGRGEGGGDRLGEGGGLRVTARVAVRTEDAHLSARQRRRARVAPPADEPEPAIIHLRLPVTGDPNDDIAAMHRLRDLLAEFPGEDRLILHLPTGGGEVLLRTSLRVDWCPDLAHVLEEAVGSGQFWCEIPAGRQNADQRPELALSA